MSFSDFSGFGSDPLRRMWIYQRYERATFVFYYFFFHFDLGKSLPLKAPSHPLFNLFLFECCFRKIRLRGGSLILLIAIYLDV